MPHRTWWPLMVPFHADPELLGNAAPHAHYDARFLSVAQLGHLPTRFDLGDEPFLGAFRYILRVDGVARLALIPRLCLREMPAHPRPNHLRDKIGAAHRRLSSCLKCPHRGFDLRQVPARGGRLVCPGHGLVWDAVTGEPITEVPR